MSAISRILFATDFSPPAEAALDQAALLGRNLGARVDAVHVWQPPAPLPGEELFSADTLVYAERERIAADERRYKLEAVVEALSARGAPTVRQLLVQGDAAPELRRLSESGEYQLVVIGASERLLGGVAAALERHSPCPVLTVPLAVPRSARPPSKLLLATDLSEGAERAAAWAAEVTCDLRAVLTLLHVYPLPAHVLPDGSVLLASAENLQTALRQAEEELDGLRQRLLWPGLVIETSLVSGDPAECILAAAPGHDLVVMGTHGRTGFRRLVLGSVAERVIRHARTPIFTVRNPAATPAHLHPPIL